MTDEYLWPARNVAEYAYCPRLFYLMEVEGIFLPSADTEKGNAVHKRVNRRGKPPEDDTDPEKPSKIRSLALTSKELGLTATVDLAEISGKSAVPVEYRKGRPRRNHLEQEDESPEKDGDHDDLPPEPWPTDRVQIGLQSLLLKDAGYEVNKGVIYYSAEKLRLDIPANDTLLSEALSAL